VAIVVEEWIQPQHLDEGAIARYRDEFTGSPARLVMLRDFLREDKAERLKNYLTVDAEYETEHGLRSSPGAAVGEAQWLAAPDEDRFFRYSKLSGVRANSEFSPNTLAYMQFRSAFADSNFRRFFEKVSGLSLRFAREDIGVHAMRSGDYLRAHDDDSQDRRLAMVLYLEPGWEPAYGGLLRMVDSEGGVSEVPPDYNSIVMFDVKAGTTHEVTKVTASDGSVRRTIGGWYHDAS
jgi:Rps23 Pro-64 3,4-dihydroxylase Tpa1-like proline 4-hydroxylase